MPDNTQGQQEPIVSLDDVIGGPFAGGDSTPDTGTNPTPATPANQPPATPPTSIDTGNQPDLNSQEPIVLDQVDDNFDTFVSRLTAPTEEDKETIESVLSAFKGTNIDTKGNILNEKGEVILSAEKLKAYVDEDILPLDDKGNMVNEKGEILQTAQELLQQDSLVLATKASLESNFGITFPEGYEAEDTEEGLINLVNDAIAIRNNSSIRDFLDSSPTLKSFYQHLVLGNSPETFNNTNIDYRGIDVLSLTPESKLAYIREMFRLQGNDSPDTFLEVLKSASPDVLNKSTASAILYLDKNQEAINTSREAEIKAQRDANAASDRAYWNEVKNVISKGKLNEVTIPVLERENFYQYLASPVENGMSQDMIDSENDSREFDVMVSYLRYKKYDVSKLAANISREQKVSTLKDRFNKHNKLKATSGVPHNASFKGGQGGTVSLDDIV